MTHTKGNVIQYNVYPPKRQRRGEYYPFGMQTANSWTRENTTGNNFLANGGTELNTTSNLYDLAYRHYDPVLGRMNGVDPMASKYSSVTPYNYSFNDPVALNDPSGADPYSWNSADDRRRISFNRTFYDANNGSSWNMSAYGSSFAGGGMFGSVGMGGSLSISGFNQASDYFAESNAMRWLQERFPTGEFGRGGVNGFYIKIGGVDKSSEGLTFDGVPMLATISNRYIYVKNISRQTMVNVLNPNPVAEAIYRGHREFMANPWGAGLMFFLTAPAGMGLGSTLNLGAKGLMMANTAKTALRPRVAGQFTGC